MLDLNWAPLIGACVVRKESWEKVPANLRQKLLESAATAGKEIKESGRTESEKSVRAMAKRGLNVTRMTPELEAEWRRAAEEVYPRIRGKLVPADVFDEVLRFIREYRAAKP
jgi:TRAP-type C4-dicarboxylate transport system substrate-binding protein